MHSLKILFHITFPGDPVLWSITVSSGFPYKKCFLSVFKKYFQKDRFLTAVGNVNQN